MAKGPLRALAPSVRNLVVTQEICDLLDGKFQSTGFPHFGADALTARYIAGYLVGVSLQGTSAPHVDLERLKDEDEIWMICFRVPRPGWRLFGRFLERDKFIAIRAYDRHDLPTKGAFHIAAIAMVADWNEIVGMNPVRSGDVGDYLSGVWRDADDHE